VWWILRQVQVSAARVAVLPQTLTGCKGDKCAERIRTTDKTVLRISPAILAGDNPQGTAMQTRSRPDIGRHKVITEITLLADWWLPFRHPLETRLG
jgi:hypothetical protein